MIYKRFIDPTVIFYQFIFSITQYTCILTVSTKHSVPANMAPTTAKFLAYETVRSFISFHTNFIVGVSVPVMFGSIPAVNSPKAPPTPNPNQKNHE